MTPAPHILGELVRGRSLPAAFEGTVEVVRPCRSPPDRPTLTVAKEDATKTVPEHRTARRCWIDRLRVAVIAGVIVVHTCTAYVVNPRGTTRSGRPQP